MQNAECEKQNAEFKMPNVERRMRYRGIVALCILHVAFLYSAFLVALFAASRQDQPPRPTFRTEANYVRVDVFPTTKDGAPILDLTEHDFDVLEGGAPQ